VTIPTPATVAANRQRGKRNQHIGNYCQNQVLNALRSMGVTCEPLHNQWIVHRCHKTRRIISAHQGEKIIADIAGVYRGRSILVEVKHEDGDTLSLSRIDVAQRPKLDAWRVNESSVHVAWVRLVPAIEIRWIFWRDPAWLLGSPFPWNMACPVFALDSKPRRTP
jgi:hypothetical protein